jgi:hypothetical protein
MTPDGIILTMTRRQVFVSEAQERRYPNQGSQEPQGYWTAAGADAHQDPQRVVGQSHPQVCVPFDLCLLRRPRAFEMLANAAAFCR